MDFLSVDSLPWLTEAQKKMSAARAADRLPQSLLILSQPGLGAEALAAWICALALCESRTAAPCGVCGSCVLLRADSHPDFHRHPPGGVDKSAPGGANLHEQRVVKRRDDSARDRRTAVGPDSHSAYRSVVGDPSVIGREPVFGVFGGDPALNGEALDLNRILRGPADSGSARGAPCTIKIWLLTRSTPVTISVTVCST